MRNAAILLLIGALMVVLTPWAAAAPPVKDICKDCVDPYVPTAERARFFKVAGKDNEIDAGEFDAAKAAGGGFVRKFDTWAGMLAFDKNRDGKLDHTERKGMEDQRSKWQQRSNVIINGRSISPGQGGVRILNAWEATVGGGVTVWQSEDGAAGGTVIIRSVEKNEQDK